MGGPPEASISAYPGGPLLVRGDYVVKDGAGNVIPPRRRTVALCCCGASSIKPWCDGSHKLSTAGVDGCASPPEE
ncbi:MAG TPA: CDGSH iron-sulfur domain-containing protein [Actinomycetota bacterium]|nr:CDGSH iron-sulfur domain-containing protein [Actinomycetota bacterium]